MKPVERFLKLNGFTKGKQCFYNDMCCVVIHKDHYEIDRLDGRVYSDNLSIYWLIGVLTYYNLIDKNYKQ